MNLRTTIAAEVPLKAKILLNPTRKKIIVLTIECLIKYRVFKNDNSFPLSKEVAEPIIETHREDHPQQVFDKK